MCVEMCCDSVRRRTVFNRNVKALRYLTFSFYNFPATQRGLIPVLPHKFVEAGSMMADTPTRLTHFFTDSPVHGSHQCVFTAQVVAPGQDSSPVAPYFIADLSEFLRVDTAHCDPSASGTLPPPFFSASFSVRLKWMSPCLTSSSAMLVFLRLSGSAAIRGGAPRSSCLLLKAATTISRYLESIPGH